MGLKIFVTRELFPFTAGGIGRVVANIFETTAIEERPKMAVLFVGDSVDEHSFKAIYPDIRFIAAREADYKCVDEEGNLFPPKHAFSTSWLHWESILVLQTLLKLEKEEGAAEYVEFIDWGGSAFASAQEKRLGRGLLKTTLAIRLHTTDSVLAAYEKRSQDVHGLALYDLERKALADCDVIVGQLAPVAEAMRDFYAFNADEWNPKVMLHAPPVLLDAVPRASRTHTFDSQTALVFSSKLQDIKRPDVFVRGCVQFMLSHPEYLGEVRFLAHAFDAGYRARIQSLVPKSLAKRFVFLRGLVGLARERIIASSVCIFPSPWESFCLAAYEASLSGALCVVNCNNPAFGDRTPWINNVNCYTFDGTPSGLASVLTQAFEISGSANLSPIHPPANPLPWNRLPVVCGDAIDNMDRSDLALVVTHYENGAGLIATLDSVAASSCVPHSVIIVDDGSRDALSKEVLTRLEHAATPVIVIRLGDHRGAAAAMNAAVERVTTAFVGFVSAGSILAPDFLEVAVGGLLRSPEFDLITGQQAYGASLEDVAQVGPQDPWRYWIVHGEARASGHVQNRYVSDAFVTRAPQVCARRFDESLRGRGVWEFMLASISSGARCLVWQCVGVVSRATPANDDSAGRHAWSAPVAYSELFAGKQISYGTVKLPAYTFASVGHAASASILEQDYQQMYLELRSSESVRTALFFSQFLERKLPWLLRLLRRLMLWGVQMRPR